MLSFPDLFLITNFVAAPQAIVFIVGGGNYIEYQNLMDYSKVCVLLKISGTWYQDIGANIGCLTFPLAL